MALMFGHFKKTIFSLLPDILEVLRLPSAARPGEVWLSDISYVRTKRGWLYLTVIIDLYDKKVVGWAMSRGLSTTETIIAAWFMAITNRPIKDNLIFHSDRGVQYASEEFTEILKANELITRSMSSLSATLSIFEWIESWYNKRRRHSALGYKTIDEFKKMNNFINAASLK